MSEFESIFRIKATQDGLFIVSETGCVWEWEENWDAHDDDIEVLTVAMSKESIEPKPAR